MKQFELKKPMTLDEIFASIQLRLEYEEEIFDKLGPIQATIHFKVTEAEALRYIESFQRQNE